MRVADLLFFSTSPKIYFCMIVTEHKKHIVTSYKGWNCFLYFISCINTQPEGRVCMNTDERVSGKLVSSQIYYQLRIE